MIAKDLERRIGRGLDGLARGVALIGGIILVALASLTLVSVIGRKINSGGFRAISGDYELVEMGCAIAIFAFLPLCHLRRGHVTVDIFTNRLPAIVQRGLILVGDILVAIVAFVVMWRLYLGVGEKFPYFSQDWRDALSMGYKPFFPETTYELAMPIWIPMAIALVGAVLFCVVALYCVWRDLNDLPGQEGAQ